MDKIVTQQILRGIWVALIIAAAGALLYFVTPLVYPFLIAWLLAYMLNPVVNGLQRRAKLPRWLSTVLSLLVFVGMALSLLTLAITNIVSELGYLIQSIQGNISVWIEDFMNFINSEFIQNIITQANNFYTENPGYQKSIQDTLNKFSANITNLGTWLINLSFDSALKLISSLPSIAYVLVVVLLGTFFISKDWSKLKTRLASLFSDATNKRASAIWDDLHKALFGYIRAQLVMISITAFVVILALLLLRVEYAVTIGLLIGLLDLMPYLGPGAALIPWITFTFLYGNVSLGIGLSILYALILIVRQTIEPKVLASSVGLNAFATLIALVVGLNLFGVRGLIIGPVTLVVLLAFHRAGVFRDLKRYVLFGSAESKTE